MPGLWSSASEEFGAIQSQEPCVPFFSYLSRARECLVPGPSAFEDFDEGNSQVDKLAKSGTD